MNLFLVTDFNGMLTNIPRIYTAIAQFLAIFIYIRYSPKRFNKRITLILSLIFLLSYVFLHIWLATWSINLWILGMISTAVLMYINILVLTKFGSFASGYFAVVAFIVAELFASLTWQLEYFLITNNFANFLTFSPNRATNYHLSISSLMIVIYTITFIAFNMLERRYQKNHNNFLPTLNDFFTAMVTAILVFSISNISFLNINTPISSTNIMEMFYIRTLVDLVGVIILYAQREQKHSSHNKLEVLIMKSMLDKQYEQFQQSVSSIDNINRKYHDLKHHIEVLKNEVDIEKKSQYINELEKTIKSIDNIFSTNNRVIDVILNSKYETIKQHDINLTVVADATNLEKVSVLDLVSIFSNSLDNAIESLKLVSDIERRLLKILITEDKGLTIIKMENYYETKIRFDSGKFLSTKGNELYHGFGIRSIKHAVDKYQGYLKIDTSNNWFTLIIALQL